MCIQFLLKSQYLATNCVSSNWDWDYTSDPRDKNQLSHELVIDGLVTPSLVLASGYLFYKQNKQL